MKKCSGGAKPRPYIDLNMSRNRRGGVQPRPKMHSKNVYRCFVLGEIRGNETKKDNRSGKQDIKANLPLLIGKNNLAFKPGRQLVFGVG